MYNYFFFSGIEVVPVPDTDGITVDESVTNAGLEFFFSGASAVAEGVTVAIFANFQDGSALSSKHLIPCQVMICYQREIFGPV